MKKSFIQILMAFSTFIVLITACTPTLEKKVTINEVSEISPLLNNIFEAKKASYIIQELEAEARSYDAAIQINPDAEVPTFKERIETLSFQYDIILEENLKDSILKRNQFKTDSILK